MSTSRRIKKPDHPQTQAIGPQTLKNFGLKVQILDARELFVKMRKSLGEKRKQISDEQIDEITRLYGDF